MIDSEFIKKSNLDIVNVSRETFKDLNIFVESILSKNKEINLISKKTEKNINNRHIIDSAQTIDFVDKKDIKICTDVGPGAGLPGIVLAILLKTKKPLFKVIFYEKSYHKSTFLKNISKKLNLNTEIHQKNIFEQKNLYTDIIISRAFKPLPVMFSIASENFKTFKYIVSYLGRGGKKILQDASLSWEFNYEEKKSLTSNESSIVKIFNLKKKWKKK